MDSHSSDGPPRAVLIAALLIAVTGVVAVLVVAAVRQSPSAPDPVVISSVPAPQADSGECDALIGALPDELGDYHRASVVEPAPAGTAAWQADDAGAEPLILRCGLTRPAEFVVGAPLQVVDAVQWFRVGAAGAGNDSVGEAGAGREGAGEGPSQEAGRSTWFAVDRPVYVALTLPTGSGPTPIQLLSATIAETLPDRPIDPGPVG